MKRKDIVLIALALLVALALYGGNRLLADKNADTVVVTVDGVEKLRVPLSAEGVYSVPLAEGEENVIAVEGGAVWMQSANCRDQLCVQQGRTRSAGKQIVCLPHRVVVSLERTQGAAVQEDDLDVVVR